MFKKIANTSLDIRGYGYGCEFSSLKTGNGSGYGELLYYSSGNGGNDYTDSCRYEDGSGYGYSDGGYSGGDGCGSNYYGDFISEA